MKKQNKDAVIVTGSEGALGQALCAVFREAGSYVVGTDKQGNGTGVDHFVEGDLERLCREAEYRNSVVKTLNAALGDRKLKCLVNNAGVQIVKPSLELTAGDWNQTWHVNVLAPFLLAQSLLHALQNAGGSIVNIASVHAKATKPGFVAYATSKAALVGLTAAMAVDLGPGIRVNAICPAAVSTPMLEAGFGGRAEDFKRLGDMHPAGRIGKVEEVARAALYLASSEAAFITGAAWYVDGGISVRLHDPT